jgi:hypothetical protein
LVQQLLTDLQDPLIDSERHILIKKRTDVGDCLLGMHEGDEMLVIETVEDIAHFFDDL